MQIHLQEDVQSIVPSSLSLSLSLIIDNETVNIAQLRSIQSSYELHFYVKSERWKEFSKIYFEISFEILNIFVYFYT